MGLEHASTIVQFASLSLCQTSLSLLAERLELDWLPLLQVVPGGGELESIDPILPEQLAGAMESRTRIDVARSEYWAAENREGVSILLGVSMLSVIDLEGEGMVGA